MSRRVTPPDSARGRARDEYVPRRARPRRGRRARIILIPLAIVAVVLAGAGLSGVDPVAMVERVTQSAPASALIGSDHRGGTLVVRSQGPVSAWDPQRIATRETAGFASRTYLRTLTAYTPAGEDGGDELVGDLATDTGRPNKNLTAWSFTLRKGVTWQDGSPVTCQDVAYGVSRSFAEQISGGPSYALAYLAVPKESNGLSTYAGPYATGKDAEEGRKAFEKAVSCSDDTITFHLSEPVADFGDMVSLPAFAPFKKKVDQRKKSHYQAFSNGPYQLVSPWRTGTGGTWVRNPHWDAETDPIRRALPDRIDYREGEEPQDVAEEIMRNDGDGRRSVSLDPAPPALEQHLDELGDLDRRAVNPRSQLVDYLAPNLRSPVMKKKDARLALALATNRTAYVDGLGGGRAATATYSLLCPTLSAHDGKDVLGSGPTGNLEAARKRLKKAGFSLPVRIRVAYRESTTSNRAMDNLVKTWDDAGFQPVLEAVGDDYFTDIARASAKDDYDVFWANWAADWPSASTVLPPLFDSRINLTDAGSGRDYGYVDDGKLNSMMTKAGHTRDDAARDEQWRMADERLRGRGDYIALAQRRSLFVAGSDVRNLQATQVYGGIVDLAVIGVS